MKIHRSPGCEEILAACDCELLNTTLSDEKIEIEVSENFYGNEKVTEEEFEEALKKATNANLIGKRVIAVAVRCGLADEDYCIYIQDIPHAQIL
ncbi:DUF424 domain-containing protein [Methanoplanus endosymbiosus]|uniref:DUF424 family protein n=1 Tax=Methanoplanus endosymbiosus TaxID=33865 RepID=A0A9E7PRB6_9EURY|nr:DUF424 family protein [Methanoplanus endosymbiosus]UUX92107.1 DUF424 family protein [Methanoplanus endosymbiosus]